MSLPESQDADHKSALPPNDAAEALTVPPQDCPEVAFAEKVGGSTPSPESETEDVTGPYVEVTGPYRAAGGPSPPPMSDPTTGFSSGVGAEAIPGHEILGELGRGGMGVVYKARHLRLKRLVAVKMILAGEHAGSEQLARFRTESEAIARLQHLNIVQVFEVGEHREMPYFSLEFCGGGSLAMKLRKSPLPPAEAAALVQTLARAMQAAHDKGVIHRDLKPANVLLADDGTPKITDFGLAKKLDEAGQTIPGALMGTPSYMAPEQADSWRPVGPPADVYALGAILYECLTGRPPFKAASTYDTILQVVSAEPVPPRQLNPAVPRDLETICLMCLQKEPDKRYTPAQALADDLQRFLKQEPILARPATRRERFAKWCRRNPRVALLSGVVAFALVAYAVTVTWLSVNLSEQTRIANKNESDAKEAERDAKKAESIANKGQNTALDYVLSLARTRVAYDLRKQPALPHPDKPETIRRDSVMLVRNKLQEMAGDLKLTQFSSVAARQLTGDFARNLGLFGEALKEYEQGYKLLKKFTQDHPDDDKARANMAVMLLRRGNIVWEMNGDVETARKDFEEARALRQEIADHPRSGDYTALENRIALAYSAVDRGRLEFSQGNLTAAREHFARVLEARSAWVTGAEEATASEQAMATSFLSQAYMWMGVVLAHQGDQEGADKHLRKAVDLSEQVAEREKKKDLAFQDLVDIHGVRGDVQALRGDWEGASASYQEAKKYVLAAKLDQLNPVNTAGQVLLARTIERLAAAEDKKGDAKGAEGHRKTSLMLREKLTQIEPACVSWKAAWLLARAHMDGQADDEAAALAKRAAGNGELLLQLAQYHAVRAGKAATPAQRRAAAEQGLTLLGEAVKAGYADRFLLAGAPDLAALRQEAGFQALLNRQAR